MSFFILQKEIYDLQVNLRMFYKEL